MYSLYVQHWLAEGFSFSEFIGKKPQTQAWTPPQNPTKINYTIQALRKDGNLTNLKEKRKTKHEGALTWEHEQLSGSKPAAARHISCGPGPATSSLLPVTARLHPVYRVLPQHGWVWLLKKLIIFRRWCIAQVYLFIRAIMAPLRTLVL